MPPPSQMPDSKTSYEHVYRNMSKAPVLSKTAMERLMKGHHGSLVSIQVGYEVLYQIRRPLAIRFSKVWASALEKPESKVVFVTLPPEPAAAPLVGLPGPSSGSAHVPPQGVASPPTNELGKRALKFIVQWMEKGGADPRGENAVTYPKGQPGLELLLALAESLQVTELMERLRRDLGRIPVPRPKKCAKCSRLDHPGEACLTCWHCKGIGHRRDQCPIRQQEYQEYLVRQKRREERAEREEIGWRKAEEERERWDKRRRQGMIRSGQMAVGDGGRTILRWS